ncbi:MAG: GNAT family N-acetyltransferase [Polyangiaceae bacterium]
MNASCAKVAGLDRGAPVSDPRLRVPSGPIGAHAFRSGPSCPPFARFSETLELCALYTERLELRVVTLETVEAILAGDRPRAERIAGVKLPESWPGRALIERAFGSPYERLRADPASCVWSTRLLIPKDGDGVVVGSVVLNGPPDASGSLGIAYGVETQSQGRGYATEGAKAVLEWALAQPSVRRVTATTLPWHTASLRVIEKLGMRFCEGIDHELLGELSVYERFAPGR